MCTIIKKQKRKITLQKKKKTAFSIAVGRID